MTNQQHPITPPLELMEEWLGLWPQDSLVAATQWGADQELEACCDELDGINPGKYWSQRLRAVRRPKPPSLKQQALDALSAVAHYTQNQRQNLDTIRRALEELPDD